LGAQVTSLLRETRGVTFARPDRELGQLERVLTVDRERAAELGVGSAEVASAVELYVLGRVVTQYRERGDEYDLRVQLQPEQRDRLDQLPTLPVVSGDQQVPLSSLVHIQERRGPSAISRVDQERVLRVNAGVADRPLNEIVAELRPKLQALSVPEGFSVQLAGELAEQGKT